MNLKATNSGPTWKRGLTSNVGAWSLVDEDGHTVAIVCQGNDRRWFAVDGEGTVVVEHARTRNHAMREAWEAEMSAE